MLEVTDLKRWTHCPRVVFYRYCLPHIRPITGKMEEGILRHNEERDREERRLLRSYGLTEGERFFDVPLRSPTLGVSGRLDLLIITPARDAPEAEGIVVEYNSVLKNSAAKLNSKQEGVPSADGVTESGHQRKSPYSRHGRVNRR
jgi:hypothetical protein